MMTEKLREHKRLIMLPALVVIGISVIAVYIASVLYRPKLRYKRDSYSVFKDHTVTSCVVENHGRRSSEKALMSVRFLSKILDVSISPESAGKLVDMARDQFSATIELKNIDPGDKITVSFSIEKPQNEPFEVRLLDITDERPVRERAKP